MEEKFKQIKSMLIAAEKEYAEHEIRDENGMYTPERINKNIRLHSRIATMKEVLAVLEEDNAGI